MSRRRFQRNPDPLAMGEAALLLGIGYAVLAPGADGLSAFQHVLATLQQGIRIPSFGGSGGGNTRPGNAGPGAIPLPPGGGGAHGNDWGPGNQSSAGAANINVDESYVQFVGFQLSGHIGFGHAGGAQHVTVGVWASGGSVVFGFGGWGPVLLYVADVSCGEDADWTGYGVDIPYVTIDQSQVGQLLTLKVWVTIYDAASGQDMTTATIIPK